MFAKEPFKDGRINKRKKFLPNLVSDMMLMNTLNEPLTARAPTLLPTLDHRPSPSALQTCYSPSATIKNQLRQSLLQNRYVNQYVTAAPIFQPPSNDIVIKNGVNNPHEDAVAGRRSSTMLVSKKQSQSNMADLK